MSVPSRIDRQRARRLVTAAEAVRRSPAEALGLAERNGRAVPPREQIATHLEGGEACQLEAFEQALALVVERASLAFCEQEGWLDGVRAGLVALLEFFDEELELARYLMVHSAQAGGEIGERRREVLERIALLLDDERAPARGYPPRLTAQAVASGVLGVLSERLSQPQAPRLVELAGPLTSFIVSPFLGAKAARRELARPRVGLSPTETGHLDLPQGAGGRLNRRAVSVVMAVGDQPGLSNKELAALAGIEDPGQCSRLSARLARLGLIENTNAHAQFGRKAWRLTDSGEQLQTAIRREAAAEPTSAFDLPPEFVGVIDDRAVSMLRGIADQPWLRSSEVAERAGVKDEAQAARLLESLVKLGLAASEPEARQRGTPKAWRLTPAGEQLDRTIGRDTPAPPRSLAMDLMWQSGGRLSENGVSVLRGIGAEPGLSNNDIALRVGVADKNSMSQVLARLAKRDLITNTRNGGKNNVWQLTASGEKLERAIWAETPARQRRKLALELVRDHGGRLNHRVVSVLRVIGAEPELSNKDIAERVAIEARGHTSTLLARLARFRLIENLALDPAPFEVNAWVLTAAGRELEAATRGHENSPSGRSARRARRTITAKERR